MNKTVKKGYKQTKLGLIPEEWGVKMLKDLTKINQGLQIAISKRFLTPVKNSHFYITNEFLKANSEKKYYILNPPPAVVCNESDILMTRTGNTGQVVTNVKGAFHNNFFKIKYDNNKLTKKFLYYYLTSNKTQSIILKYAGVSTIPDLNHSDFYKIAIPLPPLPEQQKIAQILSTWDMAIDKTQQLITQLQLRKKGLMQQLLSGKKRLKGFDGKWESVKLKDIADRLTKRNEELNDNVVTISAQRGFVKQEDFFNKRVASKTLSGYYLIEKGHFAYNKSYSNGYPMGAFKRLDNLDKAVVTMLYICFAIKPNINSDFLLNYFEGGFLIQNLMEIAQEGGRAHGLLNIGLKDFFNLELTIPSLREQQAIAQVLTTADKEIQQYQKYLTELKTQKKGLMQQLLTGKTRVK